MAEIQYYGTGRRKSATARVYLRPGAGEVKVNHKPFDRYFPNETLRMIIRQPLQLTETTNKFDLVINVSGGGPAGQAGAIRHGITRALLEFNADLRPALKHAGLVTRDPRIKERKKYGQRARGNVSSFRSDKSDRTDESYQFHYRSPDWLLNKSIATVSTLNQLARRRL